MLNLPERGIRGNSHMIMQDRNHLQIADLILRWIDEHVAIRPPPRLALELEDYAALPITADNTNDNTRAQLARVNYLRDEPGGRRFFVNDLNGRLYILDKHMKPALVVLLLLLAASPTAATAQTPAAPAVARSTTPEQQSCSICHMPSGAGWQSATWKHWRSSFTPSPSSCT